MSSLAVYINNTTFNVAVVIRMTALLTFYFTPVFLNYLSLFGGGVLGGESISPVTNYIHESDS